LFWLCGEIKLLQIIAIIIQALSLSVFNIFARCSKIETKVLEHFCKLLEILAYLLEALSKKKKKRFLSVP